MREDFILALKRLGPREIRESYWIVPTRERRDGHGFTLLGIETNVRGRFGAGSVGFAPDCPRPSVCRSESSSTASCNWCLGGHRSPERYSGGANTYHTAHGRKYLVTHAQRSSPGLWTVRVLKAELFQQSTLLSLFFCRTG